MSKIEKDLDNIPFDDIKLYEDIILSKILEGKTKEEVVATLQNGIKINYDENFILKQLMEGKTRDDIAKILNHKNYRTLDMFMRRRGYNWDSKKGTYILKPEKKVDEIQSSPSSKVQQILTLFKAGIEPKKIAQRVGMKDHIAIANYMKNKGYIWSTEKQNYILLKGNISDIESTTPHVEEKNVYINNEATENLSKLEKLEKLIPMLEMIYRNKDRIIKVLAVNEEGTIPRYVIGGVTITKSLCMSHSLSELVKEFSREKNISQREIFEVAIIEFLKKYGYENEVNTLFL